MSNQQDFQEAFPGNDDYDPGPDHIAIALGVFLALLVVVTIATQYIPIQ